MDGLFMAGESAFFADEYPLANTYYEKLVKAFPNNRLLASATIDRLRHNAYCIELEGPSGRNPKVAPPKSKLANGQKSAHS